MGQVGKKDGVWCGARKGKITKKDSVWCGNGCHYFALLNGLLLDAVVSLNFNSPAHWKTRAVLCACACIRRWHGPAGRTQLHVYRLRTDCGHALHCHRDKTKSSRQKLCWRITRYTRTIPLWGQTFLLGFRDLRHCAEAYLSCNLGPRGTHGCESIIRMISYFRNIEGYST